jgi:hypothetical protein
VLSVGHYGAAWNEVRLRDNMLAAVEVSASLDGDILSCFFFHQPGRAPLERVEALAAAAERFLSGLLQQEAQADRESGGLTD